MHQRFGLTILISLQALMSDVNTNNVLTIIVYR